ncbi:MAG: alpha/beta hydrolase [Betaproteobacteria bacterium]|nr:alpha/beta hydrolase [Betaproteobacteria bacterium]
MKRSGYLKRPDCSLYFEVMGEGPAIVFAHGLGGNQLSWWQQLAHFSARHTCVAFAHRGFTPSSAVPGAAAPAAYADDLAALIDELQLQDVRLVAQSMGGWTCMEYALRKPGTLRSLVMACTSGALDFRQLQGPAEAQIAEWLQRAPKTMADLESRGILSAHGERMAREQPVAAVLYRQISQLTPADFKAAVRGRIFQMRDRSPALLANLTLPVLFLTGDEDCLFPAAAGPGFAALAPRGRAVCVREAGHSVYFERPAEFNRIVDEFHEAS